MREATHTLVREVYHRYFLQSRQKGTHTKALTKRSGEKNCFPLKRLDNLDLKLVNNSVQWHFIEIFIEINLCDV